MCSSGVLEQRVIPFSFSPVLLFSASSSASTLRYVFARPLADECQTRRFGAQCTACPDCPDGTFCDSLITGTGRCVPSSSSSAPSTAASSCSCTNGICSSSTSCACNPGWADAPGGQRCSICASGFYASTSSSADGTTQCLACGPGCTACAAQSGSCSTCQTGLQVSSDDPRSCVQQRFLPSGGTAFTSCQTGFYLSDSTSGTCTPCSASCAECFGPAADQCYACTGSGRGLLHGRCVSIDAGTGICDGSALSAGSALAWVYNNESKVCDRECSPFQLSLALACDDRGE